MSLVARGAGSASVSADDLRLVADPFPLNEFGLLLMGDAQGSTFAGDGRLCLAGNLYRFKVKNTTTDGAIVQGPGLPHERCPFRTPCDLLNRTCSI